MGPGLDVPIGLGSAEIKPRFIEQKPLDGAEYLAAVLLGMARAAAAHS